jgi:uncharacterized protein (DUF433 family)
VTVAGASGNGKSTVAVRIAAELNAPISRAPLPSSRRCIRDLRFPVATVAAMFADDMTLDEILTEHPDLEIDDIREALRYASQVVTERELPLRTRA